MAKDIHTEKTIFFLWLWRIFEFSNWMKMAFASFYLLYRVWHYVKLLEIVYVKSKVDSRIAEIAVCARKAIFIDWNYNISSGAHFIDMW